MPVCRKLSSKARALSIVSVSDIFFSMKFNGYADFAGQYSRFSGSFGKAASLKQLLHGGLAAIR